MDNIKLFNATVALVFERCFNAFPNRINLDSVPLAVEIAELYPDEILTETKNDLDHEAMVVFDSIRWLIDAGYLWSRATTTNLSLLDVVLSPKGFEVLNSVPDALNSKESIGKLLSKGIKKLSSETINQIISAAITIGLSKSIG